MGIKYFSNFEISTIGNTCLNNRTEPCGSKLACKFTFITCNYFVIMNTYISYIVFNIRCFKILKYIFFDIARSIILRIIKHFSDYHNISKLINF